MRYIKPLSILFGIYGVWLSASWIGYTASQLWPQRTLLHPTVSLLIFLVTAFLFVLLCCQINMLYLVFVERNFRRKPAIRYVCLLTVLIAAGVMVLAARYWSISTPVFYMLYTANLIVFANLLGAWIVKPLRREPELIIVCVVMALADLFSIIRGPTRQFVESIRTYYQSDLAGPPPASDFLLIKIPVPGFSHLQPLFGVSDWIIIVFLSAAAAHFKINDNLVGKGAFTMVANRRPSLYFPLAAGGLLAALFAAGILNRFIPALPVIAFLFAAVILIRYPAARQLKPSDWRLIIIFSGAMLTLLALLLLLTT